MSDPQRVQDESPEYQKIPLAQIEIGEWNVRQRDITIGLDELAHSMKTFGLQQPIVVQPKNVKYQLTAMGTLLEGDLSQVVAAAKKMHESVFDDEVKRVITRITIDDRRDKKLTMDYKVQSVMKKLG